VATRLQGQGRLIEQKSLSRRRRQMPADTNRWLIAVSALAVCVLGAGKALNAFAQMADG